MKTQLVSFSLFVVVCFVLVLTGTASAGTVYEDGPINGQTDAWTINFGYIVSNTFTVATPNATITGMSFGAWLFPGDTLTSVELSITSDEFGGTTYFDQVVNFTASNCFLNGFGYNVCEETGSFNGPNLANGTYWMNLQNAVVPNGDPVYWDENSGIGCHSEGCPSLPSENTVGTIPPESFTIYGDSSTGSTPEPWSLALFGSGAAAIAGFMRRKWW